jgi:hypothetical protein
MVPDYRGLNSLPLHVVHFHQFAFHRLLKSSASDVSFTAADFRASCSNLVRNSFASNIPRFSNVTRFCQFRFPPVFLNLAILLFGIKLMNISIDEGNPCFETAQSFLVNSANDSIMLHFGDVPDVTIPKWIQGLEVGAFTDGATVSSIIFELGLSLHELNRHCFGTAPHLRPSRSPRLLNCSARSASFNARNCRR